MFPYNLLILPLVGGYFVLSNLVFLKYRYQRLDTPRLLLNAILVGIIISVISFYGRVLVERQFPNLYGWLCSTLNYLPIERNEKNRYLGTLLFGLLGIIILVGIINFLTWLFIGYEKVISRALNKHGDELEQLFRDSVNNGQPVQITLKNEKVYLGLVEKIPEPKKTNYIVLLPLFSGYRDKETKQMVLTTSYAPIEELIQQEENAKSIDRFRVVI